jgi:hypothetical protein
MLRDIGQKNSGNSCQLPIDKARKKTVKYLSCVPVRRGSAWLADGINNRDRGALGRIFSTGASFDAF